MLPLNARYTCTQGRNPARRLRPSSIAHTRPNLVLRRGRLLLVRLCLVNELPVDMSDKRAPQGWVVGAGAHLMKSASSELEALMAGAAGVLVLPPPSMA